MKYFKYVILTLCLAVLAACGSDELDQELQTLLSEEIILLESNQSDPTLEELYQNSEITIYGEKHYMQEQQNFIIDQLGSLNDAGYRIIVQELFYSFNWTVEDYINGDLEVLPEFLLYFDETLIEGIKTFNATVPDNQKFQLKYMDMNHWNSNLLTNLNEIEKILGEQDVFESIQDALPGSSNYDDSLDALKSSIDSNQAEYLAAWGEKWYDRIVDVVDFEILCLAWRDNGKNKEKREQTMFDHVKKFREINPNKKILINTGSYHAQKETYSGTDIPTLAKRLIQEYEGVSCLAFVGIRGESKSGFDNQQIVNFDLTKSTDGDNLIQEIDAAAGNRIGFLPFSNSYFQTQETKMSYSSGHQVIAPLGKQYDGVISYPNISVLESMSKYDYN